MPRTPLPVPTHFDPDTVGRVWRVFYQKRFARALDFAACHGIRPSGEDRHRIGLLLVDVQNTFCIPDYERFVKGKTP